jgi:hypothetical protein
MADNPAIADVLKGLRECFRVGIVLTHPQRGIHLLASHRTPLLNVFLPWCGIAKQRRKGVGADPLVLQGDVV